MLIRYEVISACDCTFGLGGTQVCYHLEPDAFFKAVPRLY
mgnify:CR=1 FL=1